MRILIPALLLLASCASPAPASKVGSAPDEGRITFHMQRADVREILDLIARRGRMSIILDGDVKGTATLSVDNLPAREVLEAVAKTFNLKLKDESAGIVRVSARRQS